MCFRRRGELHCLTAQIWLWGRWQCTAEAEKIQVCCLDMEERMWKFSRRTDVILMMREYWTLQIKTAAAGEPRTLR